MAQDQMTKTAADYEALVAQISALRGDLTQMAKDAQRMAFGNGKTLAEDLGHSATDAAAYLGGRGRAAEHAVERAVGANPWMALSLAAGIGLLLGALTRR